MWLLVRQPSERVVGFGLSPEHAQRMTLAQITNLFRGATKKGTPENRALQARQFEDDAESRQLARSVIDKILFPDRKE